MPGRRSTRLLSPFIGLLASVGVAYSAGVTLVTHGFNSDVDTWVIAMADQIPGHPAFTGAGFSCYRVDITEEGGQLAGSATFLGGTDPIVSDSGEIFRRFKQSGMFWGEAWAEDIPSLRGQIIGPGASTPSGERADNSSAYNNSKREDG